MPLAEVKVSVLDRAFLLGDAVYEVIRVYGGRPWKLDEHLDRLKSSLEAVGISSIDVALLNRRLEQTLKNSGVKEGIVYVQVTRGEAVRTHHFPDKAVPNQLIYVEELSDPYAQWRESGVSVITYPDIRWSRNYIKATSLLANCLGAQAAHEAGCVEAVLIDKEGYVTEGSHTSVFGAQNGDILLTPDSPNILPGITKRQVLRLAEKAGIPIKERRMAKAELNKLDEIFLAGTYEEILPVTVLDGSPVGDGKVGPLAARLQEAFRAAVAAWLALPGG